jgi:prevent-host-death family protein
MAVVGIRQLSRETSRVIKEFEETGEPVIVTREGRAIGALMPVDRARLEDLALASAGEIRQGLERARADYEEGRSMSIDDIARDEGVQAAGRDAEEERVASEGVAVELGSLSEGLRPDIVATMHSRLDREVESLREEALTSIGGAKTVEPAVSDLRELTELTAAVYGQLFRRNFVRRVAVQAPERALHFSQSETTTALRRSMARSVAAFGSLSLDRHMMALRGMMIAWEADHVELEGEATPVPETLESVSDVES